MNVALSRLFSNESDSTIKNRQMTKRESWATRQQQQGLGKTAKKRDVAIYLNAVVRDDGLVRVGVSRASGQHAAVQALVNPGQQQ